MIEHSEAHQQTVRLKAPRTLHPGENIVPRGAEARAGDLLVPAGVRIGPAHIAIAAQTGSTELAVFAQPRVAILSTGDELVSASDTPGPSQIRNSNGPMLAAMAAAAGGNPVILPTAPDREDRLNAVLAEILAAAPNFDLLLISGGISFGKFDLVADTLGRLGAEVLFAGVAIQPGKPVAFGQLPGAGQILPFFALPGNPLSSAVTFQLFAAPLLATLGGLSGSKPRFASAEFKGIWKGSPGLTRFLPAYCDFAPDQATAPHALPVQVRLVPWQGSGDIAAYARSNCFVVVPSQTGELQQGAIVPILLS
jgi:molybdopterin molybdotransferase